MIFNILTVAVGLGFVIFFHELGHFLLAKWNGVKVEKFSIGFDPYGLRFYAHQVGETTYVLGAIPLGGYVKMLGEDLSEQDAAAGDPRAYHNKSVGARMAIISAGVLMNLVLGMTCFVSAYARGGLLKTPAIVGAVVAGGPAYAGGVRTGDEIIAIDGRQHISFDDLMRTVSLSGTGQVVRFDLKRPGQEAPISVLLEPRREENGERPTVGIRPATSLTLTRKRPFVPPPGLTSPLKEADAGFQGEDRVIRIGPSGQGTVPVTDIFDLNRRLAEWQDKPIDFVVERAGTAQRGGANPTQVALSLPAHRFVDFGFRLKIEPISAIQGGSIAEKAGFQQGDLIVKVDGNSDLDPMNLPSYCYEHAGVPVSFEVERHLPAGDISRLTLTVAPDATPPWTEMLFATEPLKIAGLGMAYMVSPSIMAVKEGSPAARAGLKFGDVIRSMKVQLPDPEGGKPEPFDCTFDDKKFAWPFAFELIQEEGGYEGGTASARAVEITIARSKKPISIVPEPDPKWFHPDRGLRFEFLKRPLPSKSLAESIRSGAEETRENVVSIYFMLRGLRQGRVSPKQIGGPIRIATMAYYFATSGLATFLWFLGMLSVNLAVLNFLPIPPLDGGQMMFLVGEKLRGRPLPDSVVSAGTITGVVLVLGLMVFIIYQDVVFSFFS